MPDADSQPDLSIVETNDLIAELMRRHDQILIVRERRETPNSYFALTDFNGGASAALGLAHRGRMFIERLCQSAMDEAEGEDEANG